MTTKHELNKSELAIIATAYNNEHGRGWVKLPNQRLATRNAMKSLKTKGIVQYVVTGSWSGNQIIDTPVQSKYTMTWINIDQPRPNLDIIHIGKLTLVLSKGVAADRVDMVGGAYGDTSLNAESNSRVAAHWDGYIHNNGGSPKIIAGNSTPDE
jgi:hypothetical protein